MSESKTPGMAARTYRYRTSIKYAAAGRQTLSPGQRLDGRLLRVLAWSVRVVLCYGSRETTNRDRESALLSVAAIVQAGKTYVLYRRAMLRLLAWPKPAFDQLAIALPCLMAFRAKEVGTWRAEYIDFQEGDAQVLDAKKKRLFVVPLNTQVARDAEKVLEGRGDGYVLRSRSHVWKDKGTPLTPTAIWFIWHKWIQLAGLDHVEDLSPLTGRRFFAAEWYYSQGLSLVTLQRIMRHTHFETTVHYVHTLVFHEDVKHDYDRFQLRLMQDTAPELRT